MTRAARIAVSGSAGTGKTALGMALAQRLDLPFIPEGMRERLAAGLNVHALSGGQFRDLVVELYDEAQAHMARATERHGGFVADRGPIDYMAFWLYYGFADDQAATEAFAARTAEDAARLDVTVVLPWGAIPLASDGIRSPNPWRQLHFQALFEGLARTRIESERLLWLPADVLVLPDRVAWALERAEALRRQ